MNDVRTFQEGIRWQKHEMSADYVPAALRERFLDAHEEIDKDLRIDDYEIQRVKAEASGNDAYVRMKYTWHLDSVGTVHETTTEQHWELQGKIWRIIGSEHVRGERMPTSVVVSKGSALP